jgi:ribosomal protein S18 acetylase RimI-like enzyme
MGASGGGYRCRVAEIRDSTPADFDAVFELIDTRSRAAFGVSEQKPEYLRQRWALPGYDKWVAVDDGAIVGYAALDEDQEFVHTAADATVGDELLAHVERQARARGFGQLSATAVPEDVPLSAALQRHGYRLDREVLRMWRVLDDPLPEPVWTTGVTVRSYTDGDGTRVQALLDATYTGWDEGYVARSHEGWLSFMTKHDDFDPEMWFLVERDGELIACALHWRGHQGRGWVKDIVVHERERGRGLGKALIHHGFREYAARGVDRVGLKVDSTNPTGAPQLYERLGFVTDQRLGIWTKQL